ncbi:MAG: CopG family ribbon-helix-helix protein [Gemmatimonadales bacterium]
MPLKRISITIPESVVNQADERARALDRSRSWLVVEALRRYLARPLPEGRGQTVVQETPASPYSVCQPVDVAGEIAAARVHRLRAELRLAPEERLGRAEQLGRLGREAQQKSPRLQVIGFSSYDDYYEWKRAQLIGG